MVECAKNSEYNDKELRVLFAVRIIPNVCRRRAAGAPQGTPQAPQALQARSPLRLIALRCFAWALGPFAGNSGTWELGAFDHRCICIPVAVCQKSCSP